MTLILSVMLLSETLYLTMLPYDANFISPPQQPALKMVSYRRYHRIDIDQFRSDLSSIPFVLSPVGNAAELYDQYVVGVTQVLDKHAPVISRMEKRQSDEWLSDSYCMN